MIDDASTPPPPDDEIPGMPLHQAATGSPTHPVDGTDRESLARLFAEISELADELSSGAIPDRTETILDGILRGARRPGPADRDEGPSDEPSELGEASCVGQSIFDGHGLPDLAGHCPPGLGADWLQRLWQVQEGVDRLGRELSAMTMQAQQMVNLARQAQAEAREDRASAHAAYAQAVKLLADARAYDDAALTRAAEIVRGAREAAQEILRGARDAAGRQPAADGSCANSEAIAALAWHLQADRESLLRVCAAWAGSSADNNSPFTRLQELLAGAENADRESAALVILDSCETAGQSQQSNPGAEAPAAELAGKLARAFAVSPGDSAAVSSTREPASRSPEPGAPPESPDRPDAGQESLRIGVLGTFTINGQPGALLPAQSQLVLALALHGASGLSNAQLCYLLGVDPDRPKPSDSLRQLIGRTRRQLGRAPDRREWIEHLGDGQYALHPSARFDWHEFDGLAAEGMRARDPHRLRRALGLIRGHPFTGCYYWWLDLALTETVRAQIVDAADVLAGLELANGDPAAAARAARIGLTGDPGAEQLWRGLMRAEHASGNPSGVREAWTRCLDAISEIAPDGEPHPGTAALYRELLGDGAPGQPFQASMHAITS